MLSAIPVPPDSFIFKRPCHGPQYKLSILRSLGQKPNFLSVPKSAVVEHHGRLSERPSVVQLLYDFPRKVKGKWHKAPSALPYNVFTTCVGKRENRK
jgi:hypothetical protein